jgi:hypothetical protein
MGNISVTPVVILFFALCFVWLGHFLILFSYSAVLASYLWSQSLIFYPHGSFLMDIVAALPLVVFRLIRSRYMPQCRSTSEVSAVSSPLSYVAQLYAPQPARTSNSWPAPQSRQPCFFQSSASTAGPRGAAHNTYVVELRIKESASTGKGL